MMGAMANAARPLARCTMPGCPWRWTAPGSTDHACPDHDDHSPLRSAAASLGIDLGAIPGADRGDGDGGRRDR